MDENFLDKEKNLSIRELVSVFEEETEDDLFYIDKSNRKSMVLSNSHQDKINKFNALYDKNLQLSVANLNGS